MDNGWKELDINNLPPDILVGDYEFQFREPKKWTYYVVDGVYEIIEELESGCEIRYRPRQPEPPSHEEMAGKYMQNVELGVLVNMAIVELIKTAFIDGRKSVIVPPEAE